MIFSAFFCLLLHINFSLGSIGLMLMIASSIINMKDPVDGLIALLGYFFTILAALIIHFFVALPIVYWIFTRKESLQVYVRLLEGVGNGMCFKQQVLSSNQLSSLLAIRSFKIYS